ncbi:sigma-70 family RNA polymerase sigma factor [Rathayibacter sp. VKM Ac-2856]|uniref:RNA polymerase sigma factor n=1 Tax=unclassified Rathayibacter TaxID=2609250 RepID=UPI001565B43F|nr:MULTISPECIES: sigma-70 family RNA polymerase sigma factor [unclassified Rathayibacter]NQX03317.1 sigma-70 family RNA polymerase sigma factor [Rathayibacter sp. VKM Ac-2858]NQX18485.1 sigma-70 family RNA polymerase sigma factor [Rathayibacter sp. VKM Ac-2856]
MDRLRGGDPSALDALFRMHGRAVHRAAGGFLLDAGHAEDVVQESFFLLWQRRSSVRIAGESVLPWLLVTARNRSHSTNRREQRRRHQPLSDDLASRGVDAETSDRLLDVRRLVEQMSATDRAIWTACIEDDLSYSDAARSLGLSHGTVRNRLSRVRASVTSTLTERTEDHGQS